MNAISTVVALFACTSPQNYTGLADGGHTFEVRATDALGNTDPTPASFNWTVDAITPEVAIGALIDEVIALGLPRRIESSFLRELDGAIAKLTDNSAKNDSVAVNKLDSFISKVADERGATLTDEQADHLIGEATIIIDEIQLMLGFESVDDELLDLLTL